MELTTTGEELRRSCQEAIAAEMAAEHREAEALHEVSVAHVVLQWLSITQGSV